MDWVGARLTEDWDAGRAAYSALRREYGDYAAYYGLIVVVETIDEALAKATPGAGLVHFSSLVGKILRELSDHA